jgi:hypothetical protein
MADNTSQHETSKPQAEPRTLVVLDDERQIVYIVKPVASLMPSQS